jgi:hypothetical protein
MPTFQLTNAQKLVVSRKLLGALRAARVEHASSAAQVSGGDREPAVTLICDDELVLVTANGATRWPLGEIARVDRESILTEAGGALPISGWWYAAQAREFRAEVRSRIGQPEDADVAPATQAIPSRPPVDAVRLARVVGVLSGIVILAAVVSLVSFYGHVYRGWVIGSCLVLVSLIALPLLIYSVGLARTNSKWGDLGVAGVVFGLLASLVPLAGIVLAATYG